MQIKSDHLKNIDVLAVFIGICSFVSIFDTSFYLADLLNSFRFQYVLILFFYLGWSLYKKSIVKVVLASIFIVLNLSYLYPTWKAIKVSHPDLKIYFSNVLSSNRNHTLIINDILSKKSDIVVLQEVNSAWTESLNVLLKSYPFKIEIPREDNFGLAVYSKIEILKHRIFVSNAEVESILFNIKLKERELAILATHPLPPIGLDYWKSRNEQYSEIKEYFDGIKSSKILIGDLNTVPWSSYISNIESENNLKSINSFWDTWNTDFPIGLRIRMLITMVSKNMTGEMIVLDEVGSDHLPVLIKIKFIDRPTH